MFERERERDVVYVCERAEKKCVVSVVAMTVNIILKKRRENNKGTG